MKNPLSIISPVRWRESDEIINEYFIVQPQVTENVQKENWLPSVYHSEYRVWFRATASADYLLVFWR